LKDFEERAAFKGWRYIPVHWFAGERESQGAPVVDAWVLLAGEVALLQCEGNRSGISRPTHYSFRINKGKPYFRKLVVLLEDREVSREAAELAMSRFVELGFPDGPRFQVPPEVRVTL
jgi:hypothetical protein